MTPKQPYFYLARFTLEAQTPLAICSGTRNGGFDAALAIDACGLPILPGTSLAGVLHREYGAQFGEDDVVSLFGWQAGDQGGASFLHVANGILQDSLGHAREGLPLNTAALRHIEQDELLSHALGQIVRPVFRDSVRISHCGTADATGKFERVVLPAGNRFSCELTLWSDRQDDPRWQRVCGLLSDSSLRVGSGTRSGLGVTRVVSMHTTVLNLKDHDDYQTFSNLDRDIDAVGALEKQVIGSQPAARHGLSAEITLKPRGYWRVGQGDAPLGHYGDDNPPRLLPLTEPRIFWHDGKGVVGKAEVLVPGASIKGALSHRHCFHLNRLQGKWATLPANSLPEYDKSEDKTLQALYGFSRGDEDDLPEGAASGQAGRLYIADVYIDHADQVTAMPHNVIDRFTGGVRDRLLFSEELIWNRPVSIRIEIDTELVEDSLVGEARDVLKKSFAMALDDLTHGRLALGSACARGHGFFDGQVDWSDGGAWINDMNKTVEEAHA